MQHALERLGPGSFQDLAAAIVIAECGAQVKALGAGRDGGRDLEFRGELAWRHTMDPGQPMTKAWTGHTVFQVKHKATISADHPENASWVWQQIRAELQEWGNPDTSRGPAPDQLVFVTNVPLTPVPDSGGLAEVQKSVSSYLSNLFDEALDQERFRKDSDPAQRLRELEARRRRMARLRAWDVWDGNQVDALVSRYDQVRRAIPGLLTVGDVLSAFTTTTSELTLEALKPALLEQGLASLMSDRYIYFDEAGGSGDSVTLERAGIDLPLLGEGPRRAALQHLLAHGDRVLRLNLRLDQKPPHIVLTGVPGNGKTTISKLLVQSFRAGFLADAADMAPTHQTVIDDTRTRLTRLRLALPTNRRWPIRVDLAAYVHQGGLASESTLMRWISRLVSDRSDAGRTSPAVLRAWLRRWPWLVVLDGLDEVTEPDTRQRLIGQIVEFAADADTENCDLFMVLTTRPTGYVERLEPTLFDQVDLAPLTPEQAIDYGIKITTLRLGDDLERRERVNSRLRAAASDETRQHLMRTPLQVLIMAIIVAAEGQISTDRYGLFWNYWETVVRREKAKTGPAGRLVSNHETHILRLHEHVGFELHRRCENSTNPESVLTVAELRTAAASVLATAGYRPYDIDRNLLDTVVDAATKRLVLLAPRHDGASEGLGFDVRSLQELMASRHLTNGAPAPALDRLRRTAASPHWRNTWLFAAGRWFHENQEHMQAELINLVEQLDSAAPHRLGRLCGIAPYLALDMLDDRMTRSIPKFSERLLLVGLRILAGPSPLDLPTIAAQLVRAARTSTQQRLVADAIRDALSCDETSATTAAQLQTWLFRVAQETKAPLEVSAWASVKKHPGQDPRATDPAAALNSITTQLQSWVDISEPPLANLLARCMSAVSTLTTIDGSALEPATSILVALGDTEAAEILEEVLIGAQVAMPELTETLRDLVVLPIVNRQPVGDTLTWD